MEIISFVLLGIVAGFFAGLLGVGGGIITVPVMTLLLLPLFDLPAENMMHIAVASSLAAIIPTSIMSAYGHHRQGGIIWSIAYKLTPGLLLGAGLGAYLVSRIDTSSLQFSLAFFLFIVSLYMFFSPQFWIKSARDKIRIFALWSLPIGLFSSMMGVGGGTMTVPFLLWRGLDIRKAIGISAYCGLPIAFASSVCFYFIQQSAEGQSAVNFLYLPAVVGISLGSLFFAPIGANFTHKYSMMVIKRTFSVVLMIASLQLLDIV